jgi:hypothetical protein
MPQTKEIKSIHLTDNGPIKLIQERAKREHRSLSNALAVTVIEHLSSEFGKQDISGGNNSQTFLDTVKVKTEKMNGKE